MSDSESDLKTINSDNTISNTESDSKEIIVQDKNVVNNDNSSNTESSNKEEILSDKIQDNKEATNSKIQKKDAIVTGNFPVKKKDVSASSVKCCCCCKETTVKEKCCVKKEDTNLNTGSCNKDTIVSGNLLVKNDTTICKKLKVNGKSIFKGKAVFEKDVTFESQSANVIGDFGIGGSLVVVDNATIAGTLTIGSSAVASNKAVAALAVNAPATFSQLPTCSQTPTLASQLVNKEYVDNNSSGGSAVLTSNNTWTGTNAFNTSLPTSTQTPTSSNQLVTKSYADTALLASNNTWTGTNEFNANLPTSTATPTSSTQLTTKAYVDSAISAGAGNATTVTTTADTTNATFYFPFVSSATTGNKSYNVSTGLQINPSTGVVTVPASTSSVSPTTGALVVSGGLGVGENINVAGFSNSSSTSTGAIICAGGLGLAGNIWAGGYIKTIDTTASSSTTTGSLIAGGGAGIAGNVWAGGTLNVTGATTLGGDLAVNGGDITTSATTFNLVNDTATTINLGGAATSLIMGASSSTASVTIQSTKNAGGGGIGALVVAGGVYTDKDIICGNDISAFRNCFISGSLVLPPNPDITSDPPLPLTYGPTYSNVDTTGGAVTITLGAVDAGVIKIIVLKSGSNNLTVNNTDSSLLLTYTAAGNAATFLYTGLAWIVLNKNF